jgi:hypothetical protein
VNQNMLRAFHGLEDAMNHGEFDELGAISHDRGEASWQGDGSPDFPLILAMDLQRPKCT